MDGRAGWFGWHARARVFDTVGPVPPRQGGGGGVIAPESSGLALALALAEPGRPFRIGGAGDLGGADVGLFETLTSGSSGQPRRIRRSMASWTAGFAVNARLFGIGPGVRVAVLGGLVQSLALYGAVEAVHLGAELHLLDRLRPDRQRAALSARGIAVLYATPTQLRLLVEAGDTPLPGLRLILTGGSKLDPGLGAALAAITPARVQEFYGAAEASFITLALPGDPPASVGRAYPGVEIALRAVDSLGRGEIWLRSPYLFLGYGGADPGSARRDGDWLTVGEIGWMAGGCLHLAGRAGRMVTVADQNVFPEEIESFLATLPGVRRVAVLPRADARRGAVLLAVVRGDRDAGPAILAAARARLGPLQAPRALIWRRDWPLLPSGKTDLVRLAREAGL